MTIIERQAELGRSLFQINADTLRGFFEAQRDNTQKYFELNRSYVGKLPEVRDIGSYMAMQRDYNESLWSGIRSSVESQTALLKEALEETGSALKKAFDPDAASATAASATPVETVEEAPATSAAKPKTKARAPRKTDA